MPQIREINISHCPSEPGYRKLGYQRSSGHELHYIGIDHEDDNLIVEALDDMTKGELEKLAATIVREEIMDTYQKGVALQTDIFSLEHLLFKNETGVWRKLNATSPLLVDKSSLRTVKVDVHLDHAGMKLLPRKE